MPCVLSCLARTDDNPVLPPLLEEGELKVNKLKDWLKAAGIQYQSNAKKETLIRLYQMEVDLHRSSQAETVAAQQGGESDVDGSDVDGNGESGEGVNAAGPSAPMAAPTAAPTTPQLCMLGSTNGNVCCGGDADCDDGSGSARCGGSGCGNRPGGGALCCSGAIKKAGRDCEGPSDVGCLMP